jgi:hypothetical protein
MFLIYLARQRLLVPLLLVVVGVAVVVKVVVLFVLHFSYTMLSFKLLVDYLLI